MSGITVNGLPVGDAQATLTTAGDMLYASAAAVLARLGIGANSTMLASNGSVPSWSAAPTLSGTMVVQGSLAAGTGGAPRTWLEVYSNASTTNQQTPATSGTTLLNTTATFRNVRGTELDIGFQHLSPFAVWIQGTDPTNLATNYPLLLNPNGGNVGVGSANPGAALDVVGEVRALSGTATAAGGTKALGLGTSGPHIYVGSGAPTASAVKGSLYLRTDGTGITDRAYINTNGSTTWTALTTAG